MPRMQGCPPHCFALYVIRDSPLVWLMVILPRTFARQHVPTLARLCNAGEGFFHAAEVEGAAEAYGDFAPVV